MVSKIAIFYSCYGGMEKELWAQHRREKEL